MSQLNTNKAALKLLSITGSTLTRDANTKQSIHVTLPDRESTSKKRRSSCPNIDVFANTESNHSPYRKQGNGDRDRSLYIRRLSEMEPTPEHSDDSDDDDEDGLFDDDDNQKNDPQKRDIGDGIELMLHQLQSEAKKIEQQRYQQFVSGGKDTSSTPYEIYRKTRNQSKHSKKGGGGGIENMNWWDQPFKDHLRNSSRPIVRETGIDQFASEYMLTMLRDQEQKVLRKRQIIEEERTRPPKHNWHELKGQDFCRELRRHKRYHKV